MRNKYILPLLGAMCLFGGLAHAGEIEKINGFYAPQTLSVSTNSWTRIPSTTTVAAVSARRIGVYVDLPSTSNANMVGVFGSCSATSCSVATTIRPIELIKGSEAYFFPLSPSVCLYLMSLHTAAENVHYQEVR